MQTKPDGSEHKVKRTAGLEQPISITIALPLNRLKGDPVNRIMVSFKNLQPYTFKPSAFLLSLLHYGSKE
ncbi:hypothetical protein [Pedobacter sp. MR22-3]|uniref:hypothetical protein n=1 Tax=Pedobacter sp. MR22-3 TaxID=2994552 RepID=UPI002244FDC0|nr:hypothetical protein [Pedobacter sp. MR22-3]MCX2583635.1 hypothetical protein [Pedobacter sp. MR22-3]